MAAVTISSDFAAQEEEICHYFLLSPFYLPWSDGTGCNDLCFWMLSFKPAFSLSFTPIKRLFGSSSLSAVKVVSSAYLKLLMFFLSVLIPACNSSSSACLMMCSVYRLNKQGDSRHSCLTSFSILNQSVVPYRVLTVASLPVYRFLRRQVRWSGIYIFLRAFHSLSWSTQRLRHSPWNRWNVFLELSDFFDDPTDVGNLISGSSAFSKFSLNIWKFMVHVSLSLTWRILSITLLACEMSAIVW